MKYLRFKDMEIGVRYVITKCAKGGSLSVGDHVYLGSDQQLFNKEAMGWLPEREWQRIRIAGVELDREYYKNRLSKCKAEIIWCNKLLSKVRYMEDV